jgi:hypothetical protein
MTSRPADAPSRTGDRYVITLATSSMPMLVRLAPELQFPGLAVFRSRSVEDGRERFRLHLGYFDSAARAEQVLVKVRPAYPTALVTSAPPAASGSLDDTINTAFTLVRGAIAQLVTSDDAVPAPPAAERPAAAPAAPATTLSPTEVASAMAPQRYAVQLLWSLAPIAAASIPRLGIFRAYSLYAVSVRHRGSPEHGLRLGFFTSLDGARQVADYVRHEFPCASVVPVSYREYARARALTRPEAGAGSPPARGGIEVTEERDAPPLSATARQPDGAPRAVDRRTREELLALLGAHELEVSRDRELHVTVTAEERELLLRRPPRNLRNG